MSNPMMNPYTSPTKEELELSRQRGLAAQANPSFSLGRIQRAMGPVTPAGVGSPSTWRIISQALNTVNQPVDTSFVDQLLGTTGSPDLDQIDPLVWNDLIRNIPSPPAPAGTGSIPALQTPVPPSPAGVGRRSRRRTPSLSPTGRDWDRAMAA